MASALLLRRLVAVDADAYRALRLRGLRDCPDAFAATWEDESARPFDWFAQRLEQNFVVGGLSEVGALLGVAGLRTPNSPEVAACR